ncbi:hypothetical protein D6850_02940 [Roseovarius spongiae]|uniref:Uncharacterized protein n=1 Tax=Roseovarius spongiae TaxID=2320272 RepID=A0A3A8AW42_9RHOB|nr:hypothetical protein D6850_02940 [Roseovarius spongiae]
MLIFPERNFISYVYHACIIGGSDDPDLHVSIPNGNHSACFVKLDSIKHESCATSRLPDLWRYVRKDAEPSISPHTKRELYV